MFGYEVNLISVLAVAVIHMSLGYLWFAPSVFGRIWLRGAGITVERLIEIQSKGMKLSALLSLFSSLVIAYVLATIIGIMGFTGLLYGAVTGLLIWAGFFATSQLGPVLWEDRPMSLYAVNAGYYLVSLLLMGAVLGFWR
ncbi:MAG: DUF1761 domain-containing protein [Patescibacteria group bacterium]